jgi:hypothetical protein
MFWGHLDGQKNVWTQILPRFFGFLEFFNYRIFKTMLGKENKYVDLCIWVCSIDLWKKIKFHLAFFLHTSAIYGVLRGVSKIQSFFFRWKSCWNDCKLFIKIKNDVLYHMCTISVYIDTFILHSIKLAYFQGVSFDVC